MKKLFSLFCAIYFNAIFYRIERLKVSETVVDILLYLKCKLNLVHLRVLRL